jgi:thioredoxin-like negative regulator of GroEL
MVQRLWSSPDGTTEIWTDAAGSVVRRQRPDEESDEEEKIEELRPAAEAPDNDLVVCAVSPDGSLCARALNDHNEETARLEFFELAGAAKARRRRAPAASAKAPPKLDKAAQAQKDKLRRLLDAASPPAPPELLLMLAEATLAHGQPGHATAASLIDQWQKEHAGNRELAATWQARADELRQSLQESVQSGAAPKPRSAADGSEADWRYARAWANGATGHEREALEQLIELLGSSLAPQKERARRTMVALFDLIGPQEDLTREYRGRLQICL